ncbi:MAG: zinc transport system substrate-binding protein [Chthoniobacter sp.]|jgi:zinc/manganese transport system substrate-binding protein|nr:zinc transport system substrate-binding protein [Chthoniobacter sp.]
MKLTQISTSVLCALIVHVSGAAEKIQVLATFAPIVSFTKNVAGDAANVAMLLPPNVGPHDFALAPSDLRKIASADVVVENGLGIEAWLDHALKGGLKANALRIVASHGVETILDPAGKAEAAAAEADGGVNPHIWLDPIRAIKEVENIRDGLTARDPANGGTYLANATAFSTSLRDLDREIRRVSAGLANKRMLTFHDTFPYFAARYGFEIAGVVEAFPGKEPTPREVKRLRDLIADQRVTVLFSEPQYSSRILRSLSADLKVPIVVIDPMETGEASAGFYEVVMRKNLQSLATALK